MRPERFRFVHVVAKSEEEAQRIAPTVSSWTGEGAPPYGEPLPISRSVDARADEIAAAKALCADAEFPKQLVAAGATPMGSTRKIAGRRTSS